jgi:CheY-like chemotaxis protein
VWLPPSSVLRHGSETDSITVQPQITGLAQTARQSESYRILIVEDSFFLTTILQDLLDDLGWQIIGPAARLDDALELARNELFDAALLDINLDGAMSWDVATAIKARGIPFLFSTGYGVQSILPDDLAESTVISKPFQLPVIERMLRDMIEGRPADGTLPLS